MPHFSIIVPVYNVELYLRKCIESILNQSFRDFELILVDDGSPDNCPIICDEFLKKDNRVIVIHKKNGGLSSARNCGLDYACTQSNSEYVYFVDSDDYIDSSLLEIVNSTITEHDPDSIRFCYTKFDEKGNVIPHNSMLEQIYIHSTPNEKIDFICNKLLSFKVYYQSWNCVYKKKIITRHNLRFADNRVIFSEDTHFSTQFIFFSETTYTLSKTLYYYRKNPDGIIHTIEKEKRILINEFNNLVKSLERICPDNMKKEYYRIAHSFYIIVLPRDLSNYRDNIRKIKLLKDKAYFQKQNKKYKRNNKNIEKDLLSRWKSAIFDNYYASLNTIKFIVSMRLFKIAFFIRRKIKQYFA